MSTTSTIRLDYLIVAFVLLLASATFLVAIDLARRQPPQAPVLASTPLPQQPQPVQVTCEAPPPAAPAKVYIDYGIQRTILDPHPREPLKFDSKSDEPFTLHSDSTYGGPASVALYDSAFPDRPNALAIEGLDGVENSTLSYQPNDPALYAAMRELDVNFIEVDGPMPIEFEPHQSRGQAESSDPAEESTKTSEMMDMDTFKPASRAGASVLELTRA